MAAARRHHRTEALISGLQHRGPQRGICVASLVVGAKWGNDRIGAFCGFVSGVLFFAAFFVAQQQFTMTGEQILQSFSTYSPTALAGLVVFSLVLLFAVP